MIYQEAQIVSLQSQLADTKGKLKEVAAPTGFDMASIFIDVEMTVKFKLNVWLKKI